MKLSIILIFYATLPFIYLKISPLQPGKYSVASCRSHISGPQSPVRRRGDCGPCCVANDCLHDLRQRIFGAAVPLTVKLFPCGNCHWCHRTRDRHCDNCPYSPRRGCRIARLCWPRCAVQLGKLPPQPHNSRRCHICLTENKTS